MGAVSQIILAREFAITPASMSTMTGRLIAADIITRKVDPTEVRSNIVELTPRGRALLADIHAAWRDIDTLIAETLGAEDFGGRLRGRLSAHSKVDPHSGELIFFDYGNEPPYMTYGVADAQGQLMREVPIDLPGPRSPHDIGVSENFSILHDLPMFQDPEIFRQHGKRVVRFHRDVPARFGVIPRHAEDARPRWFDAEPCYILHVVNCWEEGDWLIMDACRS